MAKLWACRYPHLFAHKGCICERQLWGLGHIKQACPRHKSLSFFASSSSASKDVGNDKAIGALTIADILKNDAHETIQKLHALEIKKIVLLSGDNKAVSEDIGRQVGIDEVQAHILPEDKVRVIEELKKKYTVAMVGDGINDAPPYRPHI